MKTKYFVALCVGLLLIAGGVFFFLTKKPAQEEETPGIVEEQIPMLSSDELGLLLEANTGNTAVTFSLANTTGIKRIEYDLSYSAEPDVQRTVTGTIDVKPTQKKIVSNELVLGTCSSGHCKYDKGVSGIKLIIKIVKQDGKIYQSEKSLSL